MKTTNNLDDTRSLEAYLCYSDSQAIIPDDIFIHKLKVREAQAQDIGRNIARFDSSSLILLGLEIGDVARLTGRNGRKAAVKCLDSLLLENELVIRIDKILRYNLELCIGETITADSIKKQIITPSASNSNNKIVLEQLEPSVPPMLDDLYILVSSRHVSDDRPSNIGTVLLRQMVSLCSH